MLVLLVALLLLGTGLRVVQIEAFSFWTDEGLTPVRSGYTLLQILRNQIVIQDVVTIDTHPPLYYLIIRVTRRLFGETDLAYRFPSVLASVLLIALLYRFGVCLHNRTLGITAVFLTAINPLHIWYANEARMYAIFVLLMAAASYMLWQAVREELSIANGQWSMVNEKLSIHNKPIHRYTLLYILFAALALYTVYTAVFLIAAQSLFWVWLFWRRGQKRLIVGSAAVGILASLPLLPVVVPRLLSGVEANFFLVAPAVMLQDVFRFFLLGRSFTFGLGAVRFFTAVAVLLVALGVWAARRSAKRLFLLTYLFAVVLGLMVGSYLFKPMYQGVRHIMVSSPAFLLLCAWGLVWLWEKRKEKIEERREGGVRFSVFGKRFSAFSPQPSAFLLLTFCFLLFTLLLGTGHSLNNYFRNGDIAKDNFRGAVAFVESVAGANDVVVYNNAILLPLHAHYQTRTDTVVTASPIYPTRAGTPQNIAQLETLAATYDRVWFVTDPPADKRDTGQFIQQWLGDNLTLIDVYPFHARTTELEVRAYRGGVTDELELETAAFYPTNWPNFPQLLNVQIASPAPASTVAWVDLQWQALAQQDADQQMRLALVAPDQREWAVHNARLLPEAERLTDDSIAPIRTTHLFPLPDGLPAGEYTLTVQPLDETGGPVAAAVSAATLKLERPIPASTEHTVVRFDNGVALHSLELADRAVRPGQNLPFALYWSTANPQVMSTNLLYQLDVIDENGVPLREDVNQLGPDWETTWLANTTVRENGSFFIRPEAKPGRYAVRLTLRQDGDRVNGRLPGRLWNSESVTIGRFLIEPWPLNTALPDFETAVDAQFGDAITLEGVTLSQREDALSLDLVWRAAARPDDGYLVFIHLVNQAGDIVQQIDQIPVGGLRPTAGWRPTEVLLDSYQMPLPSELQPGCYELRVGFFQPDSFARLPVLVDNTFQPNDQLVIGTIDIR